MQVLIAPDSFKGSLDAHRVAQAIARGLGRCTLPPWDKARYECVPLADGGEGTAAALVQATNGRMISARVTGPLGEPVEAQFGILGDNKTAVIETAEASGLVLVPDGARDPSRTTSRGTGELMLGAIEAGCTRLIVGLGGSATNDGGTGMAEALGVQFLDKAGQPIGPGGGALERLNRIDISGLDSRLQNVSVTVACDVDNPLLGPHGATRTFAPQKGADPAMVELLERAMARYADILKRDVGIDVVHIPGAGAAGGLGAALVAFCQATLRPGFSIVSEAVGLADKLASADLVITGEGRIDGQTARGKVAAGVGKLARRYGVPVIAVAGSVADDAHELVPHILAGLYPIVPGPVTLETAMERAADYLEAAAERLACLLAIGFGLEAEGR